MVRRLKVSAVLLLCSTALFAGDIASFENLGFSADATTFAFAQYGVDDDTSHAFAELYVVDVADNAFVANGSYVETFDALLVPGQDGRGALYSVLADARPTLTHHEVDHMAVGRPVYILIDGDEPKSHLAFRDFGTGSRYEIDLLQSSRGSGTEVRASFHIVMTVTRSDGESISKTIGRPSYFREGVGSYRIVQILLAPDNRSIVFVVEKRIPTDDGFDVRFMVETAAIE